MLEADSQDAMFLKLFGNRFKGEERSSEGWVAVILFFFFLSLKACLQSFELDRAPALFGVYILQAFACTNPSCEH